MDKKPLIVVYICAVVLLVLGSLSNVVGYQTVTTSQQKLIKERINQRELLFQTICDIVNNKEIQGIILKSQISRGNFINQDFRFPVLTKNQLKQMHILGLLLSRFISKSKIQSMIGKYHFNNQDIRKETNVVIEKNTTLNREISQLQDSECDCGNEKTTRLWDFRFICFFILFPIYIIIRAIEIHLPIYLPVIIMLIIGSFFHCFWAYWPFME